MKNTSVSLFRQVLDLIPKREFEEIVMTHNGDKRKQSFDTWAHFVSMIFCQLAHANSLREICGGFYQMTPHSTKRYLSLEELYSDFRLSNPYGEYQRTNAQQGVIPVFAKKIICGEEITIWGDGSVKRDFIYVGDVADAVVRLVENFNITGEINIGSGEATSVREIVERLEKITGRTAICRCEEARKCDVPVNCLSIERARHVLQWQPVIDLDEGLRRTVSHLV